MMNPQARLELSHTSILSCRTFSSWQLRSRSLNYSSSKQLAAVEDGLTVLLSTGIDAGGQVVSCGSCLNMPGLKLMMVSHAEQLLQLLRFREQPAQLLRSKIS